MREATGTLKVHRRVGFTQVSNETVRDATLSFRARGVLLWILSHSDDFTFTSLTIAEAGTEGRDAIRKSMTELEAKGYLHRERVRIGSQWRTLIHVSDSPSAPWKSDFQASDSHESRTDFQASENQASKEDQEEDQRDRDALADAPAQSVEDIATEVTKRFYEWVKELTKGHKPPESYSAIRGIVLWALKDSYTRSEVGRALMAIQKSRPRPITKQTMTAEMQGQRGGRSGPEPSQRLVDVNEIHPDVLAAYDAGYEPEGN